MATDSAWLVVAWISLHAMAFAWACGTRVAAGSCVEWLAHLGFYVALTAVGGAACIGRLVDISWVWSGLTLMAMVITAVVDFGRGGDPVTVEVLY